MTEAELTIWVVDTVADSGKEATELGSAVAILASNLAQMPDENLKKAALSMFMAAQACNTAILAIAETMQSLMPNSKAYNAVQEAVEEQNATIREGMALIREVRI